ncbi:MAG: lysophospholipid acyltransferase family protein [Flavobacteriales bacterium]|jgi:KDO2-lipid IV(A) lauroyltransferase|nr:lysophospholipid acyltransferase family protein [Flavobacteriales bacterium]
MGAIGYYIALPFIYAIALLPFPALYLLSDGLYLVLFRLIGYRRKVVMGNLRNSFPEKSEQEIAAIAAGFQRWFCDLVLETLKTLVVRPEVVRRRVTFGQADLLRGYAERGQSIILVLGHYGNWELAGARYGQEEGVPQLYVIYHPLENPRFDKLLHHMRTRHGTKLYTMRETSKAMLRDRHLLTATAFIADQTPSPERAYWTTFLGQDTPVFLGTESLARKLGYPVVYISISRPRRGHYHMAVETLVEDPAAMPEGAITEAHTRRLERDIRNYPELWLWTHRRWKHERPAPRP